MKQKLKDIFWDDPVEGLNQLRDLLEDRADALLYREPHATNTAHDYKKAGQVLADWAWEIENDAET